MIETLVLVCAVIGILVWAMFNAEPMTEEERAVPQSPGTPHVFEGTLK